MAMGGDQHDRGDEHLAKQLLMIQVLWAWSPAIQVRFSRFRGTVQQGPVQRQETQIVQSCNTLDDFLPGFLLPTIRWSDIDLEGGVIRWRAEHEKSGYEHRTPVTPEAIEVLNAARRRNPGTANAPVLPATRNPSTCVSFPQVRFWWTRAEKLAGLEPKHGRGWHSLRRKFASDLMDQPLKVLCQLGGWKTAKTVLRCYQRADEGQLRQPLASRGRVRR